MARRPRRTSIALAAIAANAALAIVAAIVGTAGIIGILIATFRVAGETWISIGTMITAQLPADLVQLLDAFGIDIPGLLDQAATSAQLPEFGELVRQVLAVGVVVLALVLQVALAAGLVARGLWHSARRIGWHQVYGGCVTGVALLGLLVLGAPNLWLGLLVAVGLLTLVASRQALASHS
ncbi:MAG: hypothetical protein ACKN9R_02625 [Candidatus Limnocylindrus sp.]